MKLERIKGSAARRRACIFGCCLVIAAVALSPATPAGEPGKPAQSPAARVDRELLLGFLADNRTMVLIDARSPEEYGGRHLPGAINIPFDAVERNAALLPADPEFPIVVYCRTGKRAGLLQSQLQARGYTNVQVLPREQIFWEDDFMAFNCATDSVDP